MLIKTFIFFLPVLTQCRKYIKKGTCLDDIISFCYSFSGGLDIAPAGAAGGAPVSQLGDGCVDKSLHESIERSIENVSVTSFLESIGKCLFGHHN